MTDHGFTTTFTVDRTPTEAFDAITNVRGWWSDEIDGRTDQSGVEFTHQGLHPAYECFEVCSTGWGFYVDTSLRSLITTGEGQPSGRGRARPSHGRSGSRSGRVEAGVRTQRVSADLS